jgi:hypothetical protein
MTDIKDTLNEREKTCIVSGNPNEPDHWLDIEGYARLGRESINK